MATLKWYVAGVFKEASRTDPNVLEVWAPRANVFANGGGYTTIGEAEAAFAALSGAALSAYLGYVPERISYPIVYGGPRAVYLPDVNPVYTEYPYTVQGYSYSFTAFRGLDSPLDYTTLIIASGLSSGDVIPPPAPGPVPDVTIQLKRDNTLGLYSINPEDASVLPKYGTPFNKIRAKFNSTHIAVIEETMAGGFMIYEEVALAAVSPVYIYSGQRRLIEIIDAAYIGQYRVA